MAGILQVKKAGYPLDMEAFWLCDKFRDLADISHFIMSAILLLLLISSAPIIQNQSF